MKFTYKRQAKDRGKCQRRGHPTGNSKRKKNPRIISLHVKDKFSLSLTCREINRVGSLVTYFRSKGNAVNHRTLFALKPVRKVTSHH